MNTHKYSIRDLDDMLPYERDIYIHLLNKVIKEQNDKARQER